MYNKVNRTLYYDFVFLNHTLNSQQILISNHLIKVDKSVDLNQMRLQSHRYLLLTYLENYFLKALEKNNPLHFAQD